MKILKIINYILIAILFSIIFIIPSHLVDVSQNRINSITDASVNLLEKIDSEFLITINTNNNDLKAIAFDLVQLYKKHNKHLKLSFSSNLSEDEKQNLKLISDDNLIVTYKEQIKAIDIHDNILDERILSSLLQNIIHNNRQWLVFTSGHNEPEITNNNEFGLSKFAKLFKSQGISITTLNIAQYQAIPNNTSLLIVVNPEQDFLPLEKVLIKNYVDAGGKILWFAEPGSKALTFLQELFAIKLDKNVVLDPASTRLGSPHPAIKFITNYNSHEITKDIKTLTILPWSGSLDLTKVSSNWQKDVFLQSNSYDIAVSLLNSSTSPSQRAMVIADSSFILNKYLDLYANSQLLANSINWLLKDTNSYIYSPSPAKDLSYKPSKIERFSYQYLFSILLPLLLLGTGLLAERRN